MTRMGQHTEILQVRLGVAGERRIPKGEPEQGGTFSCVHSAQSVPA